MRERNKLFPNEKLNYSSFEKGRYIIPFSPYVSASTFERILKECYRRSKNRSIEEVKFDLSKVKFFDPFELGLMALWLLELKNKKGKLEVEFPSPEMGAYDFLERYGFEEFLKKNEISYVKQSEAKDKLYVGYVGFESADFVPLKFAFEREFQEYLHRLSIEGENEPLLDSIKEFEIVSAGHLRATVLKELRDNIQRHADDRLPYFIMTKFGSLDRIKNQAEYAIEWERGFFYSLLRLYREGKISNLIYFEIVVGDGGPGIHSVLGKIEDCKGKKEYEILDYAFEYDSTSDPERRLEPAKKWLRSEVEDFDKFPPATGLYQVKQVVKNYSGFLSVRSGKTILCYDFLSHPTNGKLTEGLITNWTWQLKDRRMKDLRALSSFKGTQYKILFPIHPIPYLDRMKYFEIPSYEFYPRPIFNCVIIPLKKYFLASQDLDAQFKQLQEIFREIRKNIDLFKNEISIQNRGIVLIDFADIAPGILSHKALHYLVREMMRRQNSHVAIIAVNVDKNTLSGIEVVRLYVQKNKGMQEKSLIVLDENLKINVFGVTEESQRIIENLLRQPISIEGIPGDKRRVIDQNHHIIDASEDKYHLAFPYEEVVKRLNQNLKNEIKEIILDDSNKIFHPNIRVNISNRYHVKGFFEIWKLVENSYWRNKLQKWIELNLRLLNHAVIITIGKPCHNLMESLNIQIIKWISVVNPIERLPIAEFITLDKKDKIVIFTDVIGTGESLNKILNFISEREISKILAMIDARKKEPSIKEGEYKYNGHFYKLESIIRQPLNFYIEQKPGDWSYETIKLVERTTNALIAEPIRSPEEPLWLKTEPPKEYLIGDDKVQDFLNPFIEDLALSSDSITIGHFTTKSKKHITYLFLVPRIAEYHAQEIAKVIKEHIDNIRNKSGKELNITHILYPEYNPGVKEIVNHISRLIGGKSQPVTNDEIFNISTERTWDFGKIGTAVIFDDSFSSGFTLKRLIDIAYNAKAKFIFAYTLMNRADYFTARFLSNLPYYGRADQIELQIKHLADARIPTFDISNCPICRYIEKLESMKREMESNYCKDALTEEINKWKPTSVESLREEQILKDYLSIPKEQRKEKCSLRWKLEIAKEKLGARNELGRIVAAFEKDPQRVLNLLDVLYREILYFFETEKERYNEVFYFKKKMQEALEFLAMDPTILSKNLGAILLVWYFVHSEGLLNCLQEVLDRYKENGGLLFKAIGYILIGDNLAGGRHSVTIINILTSFRQKLGKLSDPTAHLELGTVIKYLQGKAEKLILSPLYTNYCLARSGVYYYTNELDKIIGSLQKNNLEKAVQSFEEIINESSQRLRGIKAILESNLLTPSETQKLNQSYEGIRQSVEDFNRLLISESLSKEKFASVIDKFSDAMNRIDDVLNVFKCDIRKAIETTLKREQIVKLMRTLRIGKGDIAIDIDKVDFGFMREDHMERILMELFNNLKHAFSERTGESFHNKVKIQLKLLSLEDFLCMEILDNGTPCRRSKWGRGHSLVRDFAERLGGKFYPLIEIGARKEVGREGYEDYTKKSILYLGNIPSPQESIRK